MNFNISPLKHISNCFMNFKMIRLEVVHEKHNELQMFRKVFFHWRNVLNSLQILLARGKNVGQKT